MNKKILYAAASLFTALLCLTGCTESTSTESSSGKRALEDSEQETGGAAAVQTAVTTTLTPLETFTRLTAVSQVIGKTETEKQEEAPPKVTVVSEKSDRSDWFEQNKLFDMELSGDNLPDTETTWYNFSGEEETAITTVVPKPEESKASQYSERVLLEPCG